MGERNGLAVSVVALGLLVAAQPAAGHDSLAPRGAEHQWLPRETWVMEHWIPFDQVILQRELGLQGRRLEAYLFNDHHTLAALARHRGVNVSRLADRLVAAWHRRVDPGRVAMLRSRTMRLLTQGHLAQHVFFHVFHRIGLRPVSQLLFGVSSRRLDVLRKRGMTPFEIARRHGGAARGRLIAGLRALIRTRYEGALESNESSPAQARRLRDRRSQTVPCWVRSLTPTADPANPYGKARRQHGRHPRGWPFTRSQRRRDEQAAESLRQQLTARCWPRVARWNGPTPRAIAGPSTGPWSTSARPRDERPSALRCSLS